MSTKRIYSASANSRSESRGGEGTGQYPSRPSTAGEPAGYGASDLKPYAWAAPGSQASKRSLDSVIVSRRLTLPRFRETATDAQLSGPGLPPLLPLVAAADALGRPRPPSRHCG